MSDKQPDRLAEAMAADLVPAPPGDLSERVVDAMQAEAGAAALATTGRPAGGARRIWLVVAGLAAGAALAGPLWIAVRTGGEGVGAGERQVTAQETIRIGRRAVLVAERGARLRWQRGPAGGARVEQPSGEVFYRVNDGPFEVHTPVGVVRVTGTCFRVEVSDMKLMNRQNLSGAAVGAALGAAVVVTVYEGRVLLANDDRPADFELRPGQRAEMTAGGVQRLSAPGAGDRPAPAGRPPRFDETEVLRARIAEQEQELAQLRAGRAGAKKELEIEGDPRQGENKGRFLRPSQQELLARAQRCEVRWDTPNIQGVREKDRVRQGLSETEAAAMNEATKDVVAQVSSELRRLYVEMSGDSATADKLSPETMHNEIFAKSPEGARAQARRQISRELAGLAPPPADLAATPVAERTFRVMMSIGDRFERAVAERLGPERARALREKDDGWGGKSIANGCD